MMFKPHFGTCVECGKQRLIIVKAGYCKLCNERKKTGNKRSGSTNKGEIIRALKRSIRPKTRKREPTGELGLFHEIWNERDHVCEVSGAVIRQFDVRCFSHILPKGAYPRYRLLKENVKLVLPEIHQQWETGDRSDPKFEKIRERELQLKQRYNSEKRYNTFN